MQRRTPAITFRLPILHRTIMIIHPLIGDHNRRITPLHARDQNIIFQAEPGLPSSGKTRLKLDTKRHIIIMRGPFISADGVGNAVLFKRPAHLGRIILQGPDPQATERRDHKPPPGNVLADKNPAFQDPIGDPAHGQGNTVAVTKLDAAVVIHLSPGITQFEPDHIDKISEEGIHLMRPKGVVQEDPVKPTLQVHEMIPFNLFQILVTVGLDPHLGLMRLAFGKDITGRRRGQRAFF